MIFLANRSIKYIFYAFCEDFCVERWKCFEIFDTNIKSTRHCEWKNICNRRQINIIYCHPLDFAFKASRGKRWKLMGTFWDFFEFSLICLVVGTEGNWIFLYFLINHWNSSSLALLKISYNKLFGVSFPSSFEFKSFSHLTCCILNGITHANLVAKIP